MTIYDKNYMVLQWWLGSAVVRTLNLWLWGRWFHFQLLSSG